MTVKTSRWDSAELLETPEDIAAYLGAAFEENDPAIIRHAIGVAARAKGMTDIANASDLTRASLYKALSEDGNPEFSTILRVLSALGVRLGIVPAE